MCVEIANGAAPLRIEANQVCSSLIGVSLGVIAWRAFALSRVAVAIKGGPLRQLKRELKQFLLGVRDLFQLLGNDRSFS